VREPQLLGGDRDEPGGLRFVGGALHGCHVLAEDLGEDGERGARAGDRGDVEQRAGRSRQLRDAAQQHVPDQRRHHEPATRQRGVESALGHQQPQQLTDEERVPAGLPGQGLG
jgi:hypothetical protein